MSDPRFQRGSLVKLKSGGPTMCVFHVKEKKAGRPMPSALKNEYDDDCEKRVCFWHDKNDGPVIVEIPIDCLIDADHYGPEDFK